MITKESLIRGYFSLSVPIKYACGCIVYKKESELEWLAQCDFACYFCMAILHATVWKSPPCVLAPGHAFASSLATESSSLGAFFSWVHGALI
jgi:hypothetical protein